MAAAGFDILDCATPEAWVQTALARLAELLLDHANCEKKAAATALSLLFRYPQHSGLSARMSRLAREELRHFEQVQALLRERGIVHRQVPASRYARELRREVRTQEPQRLLDTLIVGAFIEARSCERFALLAPRLDARLGRFYRDLARAEARHHQQYLALAGELGGAALDERIARFAAIERELVLSQDPGFGFHSGLP